MWIDQVFRHGHSPQPDPGISRTRFDYDPLTGNLIKARNAHSSIELTYDLLDQIASETTVHNGQSATVSYRYDPLGNRIQTILPDGRHINSLYYGSGHLHHIQLDGDTITDIERDALHQAIQRTQGALTSRYDYDPMGRLKSQTATANRPWQHNGKPNPLVGGAVRRSYRYDKAGNLIQSRDHRSGALNYVYDALGRIESAVNKHSGHSERYAFDPAHNLLSGSLNSETNRKGRNIGDGNRLKTYNGIEYTHDPLGNLIYRELPDGEKQHFQYDAENQLIRAEIKKPQGNTEIWAYAYDPFGRRLSKERKDKLAWISTAPKRTHFVWDGSRLLQEYTYKGHYTYIYTDQDSYEPLAQVFYNNKDDKQYLSYYHTDQIGMPREMTDQFGNLLWYGEYSAWGYLKNETKVYQNAHQPFRLQNQYFDEETGLHYNLFRYYEPDTGRFINQDPIGLLGGANLYQFAPNAVSWGDPLGLYPTTVDSTCRQNPAFCAELFKSANSAMGTAAKAGAATVGAACAAGKCAERDDDCKPDGKLHIVYQAPDPNFPGKIYTGKASLPIGASTSADQVLRRRFTGGHHRGLLLSQAQIIHVTDSYAAVRGLEHQEFLRQQALGTATQQNTPIHFLNPRKPKYLKCANQHRARVGKP